jgi:serine acetyltransferase
MSATGLRELLREDARANRGNPKGLLAVASYRIAHAVHRAGPRALRFPVNLAHRLLTEVALGAELPASMVAGRRLQIWHCTGLVVHAGTRLGDDVVLRHNTTIGTVGDAGDAGEGHDESAAPIIGDRVDIGTSALVLGPVTVGDDAVIGAGAVVVHDVPAGATVVGNPARAIGTAAG